MSILGVLWARASIGRGSGRLTFHFAPNALRVNPFAIIIGDPNANSMPRYSFE